MPRVPRVVVPAALKRFETLCPAVYKLTLVVGLVDGSVKSAPPRESVTVLSIESEIWVDRVVCAEDRRARHAGTKSTRGTMAAGTGWGAWLSIAQDSQNTAEGNL